MFEGNIKLVMPQKLYFIIYGISRIIHPFSGGIDRLIGLERLKELISSFRLSIAKNKTTKAIPGLRESRSIHSLQKNLKHGIHPLWQTQPPGLIPCMINIYRQTQVAPSCWLKTNGIVALSFIGFDIFTGVKKLSTSKFLCSITKTRANEDIRQKPSQFIAKTKEIKGVGKKVVGPIKSPPKVINPQTNHERCSSTGPLVNQASP